MITSVHPIVVPAWLAGWEDVEVVDSVLVEDAPAARAAAAAAAPPVYDRTGRVSPFQRFGRLVSVIA